MNYIPEEGGYLKKNKNENEYDLFIWHSKASHVFMESQEKNPCTYPKGAFRLVREIKIRNP
jgi:hypothetical protein